MKPREARSKWGGSGVVELQLLTVNCHLAFWWRVERRIVEQLVGYGSLGCGCVDMCPCGNGGNK